MPLSASNDQEAAIGSNPWKSDTDDDGFDDKTEVDYGLSPTTDSSGLITHIMNNDATFGLYPSNIVLDVAIGQILLDVDGSTITLQLQLEESADLNSWTNSGLAEVWTRSVGYENKYYRVRSEK